MKGLGVRKRKVGVDMQVYLQLIIIKPVDWGGRQKTQPWTHSHFPLLLVAWLPGTTGEDGGILRFSE